MHARRLRTCKVACEEATGEQTWSKRGLMPPRVKPVCLFGPVLQNFVSSALLQHFQTVLVEEHLVKTRAQNKAMHAHSILVPQVRD